MLTRSKSGWQGIRKHGLGWQAEVRVTGHPRSIQPFPLDSDPREMQKWRTAEKKRLRESRPRAGKGTLASDAKDYLRARAAMAGIKERTYHIGLWVAEFGGRARASIKPWEIAAVRDRWLLQGPKRMMRKWKDDGIDRHGARWVDLPIALSASQVCNRLRALENLYTVLDGRHQYNPVREVDEPKEPDSEPRGLPYAIVDAIIDSMPDRGRPMKDEKRGTVNLTKLRLRVIAYTGLSHGELAGVATEDLHLDTTPPWCWIQGRNKGEGTKGTAQPLTTEGAAALRALSAAGGLGPFSPDSMRASFARSWKKLGLGDLRPYDLRHSFASEVLERTGNLDVTQLLMRHKSRETTLRYGLRAIDPVRLAAIETMRSTGAFGAGAKLARNGVEPGRVVERKEGPSPAGEESPPGENSPK